MYSLYLESQKNLKLDNLDKKAWENLEFKKLKTKLEKPGLLSKNY